MWLLESKLSVECLGKGQRQFDLLGDLWGIIQIVDFPGIHGIRITSTSPRLTKSSRTIRLEDGSSRPVAGHSCAGNSATGPMPRTSTTGDGELRHLAPTFASEPSRCRWIWQFDLAGDFGFAGWFFRRCGKACFRPFGAGVEIAAVLKGRKSAKRPNARRSQGRLGEPSARCTSTGKRPRSAIHGSETDTLVTGGLVQAGPFVQFPGPGSLLRRMKPRHQGLLDGCGGQTSGLREPSGKLCSPNHHETRA